MIDKMKGEPLHHQLKELIRAQILSGELETHAQLPSERELCDQYGISRTTVRRAMAELLSEGLVYTTIGKGTFVAPPPLQEELQPLSSFSEDMARRGMKASSQLLRLAVENANDEHAALLGIPRGAEVVALSRLRLADGFPIAIQHIWLVHHLCPVVTNFDLKEHSLYDILTNQCGLKLAYADTSIRAVIATPNDCQLLQLAHPAAILLTEQKTYLEDGNVIEFAQSRFRGDQYTLHTRYGHC